MLDVLGLVNFGIWAIAGVVTSYAELSDMGMTTAIVKFVAEHWMRKEVKRISIIISTVFFTFSILGGVVAAIILFYRKIIVVDLLKVPTDMQYEALFVVSSVVFIFYFNLVFSVYNSILQGIQRMDVTNAIIVVAKTLRAIGIYLFLSNGFGLKGMVFNSAIISFMTIGANMIFANRLIPDLKVNPFLFSFSELKRLIKYSANILGAKLISLFQDPVNKIILAAFTSLPFVSFYDVGYRVNVIAKHFFAVALMPLLPASSELDSVGGAPELERIHLTILRMLFVFILPIFLLVLFLSEPLVHVWLGPGYKMAARAIQFLLIGNFFSLMVTSQYMILQGIGKPQINTIAHGIAATINVTLGLGLVHCIGFLGVLIAGTVSLITSSLFIDWQFRKIMGIRFKDYLDQIFSSSLFIALLLGVLFIYLFRFVTFWTSWKIILFVFCYSLSYLALIKFMGAIDDNDKEILKKIYDTVKFAR